MKTLAIDPSTKSSGIAIFEDDKLIEYKCLTASSNNLFKRIHKICDELEKILENNTDINVVYMEDVLPDDVKNNNKVYKALMYLQGFICDILNSFGLTPVFIFPNEWRAQCGIHTGRGVMRESLKPKDMAFVKSQFGLDVNDDIADAICIGYVATGGKKLKEEDFCQVTSGGFEFR